MAMIDPDAPSRKEPTKRSYLHWLAVNLDKDTISHDKTLVHYNGPTSPKGSGRKPIASRKRTVAAVDGHPQSNEPKKIKTALKRPKSEKPARKQFSPRECNEEQKLINEWIEDALHNNIDVNELFQDAKLFNLTDIEDDAFQLTKYLESNDETSTAPGFGNITSVNPTSLNVRPASLDGSVNRWNETFDPELNLERLNDSLNKQSTPIKIFGKNFSTLDVPSPCSQDLSHSDLKLDETENKNLFKTEVSSPRGEENMSRSESIIDGNGNNICAETNIYDVIDPGHDQNCQLVKRPLNKTKTLFPAPRNVQQVQSFLGLTGFFRRFIQNYAKIAIPLTDLTRKDVQFEFGDIQQDAFVALKAALCSDPVLKMFNAEAEITELHTDACKFGLAAMLLQKDSEDEKLHPVYYWSVKTTPAQQKYDSYDLETLAIYKALKKLRVYLLGLKLKIFTDCQAFQRSMNKKDLVDRIAKWAIFISQFDCSLTHRAGTKMKHVDALSRIPRIMLIEDGLVANVKQMQKNDERCKTILKILETKSYDDYAVRSGILYKCAEGVSLLVVPKKLQKELIRTIHEKGHLSARKVETMVERDYLIERLGPKVTDVIGNCIACILANRKEGKKDGLLSQVVKKLEFQREVFGNPYRIIADKGGAFDSKELEVYCKDNNINLHLITTGVPRGNGQVERINRIIIPMLTKMSNDNPQQWYRHTSRLQTILNSTYTRSTGKTPFEILVGVKMRTMEDQELAEQLEEALQNDFLERRQDIRKLAKENIIKLQEENRKTYNRNRIPAINYKVGDLVAIQRTQGGGGLKLRGKFLGPYEVTQVKRRDRYGVVKVGEHEGPNVTSTSADLMKPWATLYDEDSSSSEADD